MRSMVRPSTRSRIRVTASSIVRSFVGGIPSMRTAPSPRPMPRSMRPPETSSSVASTLAVTLGSRVVGLVTQAPRRMCVVFVAISVRMG